MSSDHDQAVDVDGSPDVFASLVRLHEAASALIASRVANDATVRDASRLLGVGQRLAWTLTNFQRASSVNRMVRFLPGRRGWATLLDVFDGREEQADLVRRTRAALADFQRRCEEGGVDLSALAEPVRRSAEFESEKFRREEYLKHRAHWPIRTEAKVVANLIAPTPGQPGVGSLATVLMLHGIERTTPGPPLEIARTLMSEDALQARLPEGTDPRSVFGFSGDLPPLLEACSTPGVVGRELQPLESQEGRLRVGFTTLDPKRTAPLRLLFGQLLPQVGPLYGGPDDAVTAAVETPGPVEWCVLDTLWPRDLAAGGPWTARLSTFAGTAGIAAISSATGYPELATPLDAARLDTLDLPGQSQSATVHYRQALKAAAGALGMTLDDFEIHRWALRYSLPRTSIVAARPLAASPA